MLQALDMNFNVGSDRG